MKQYKLERLQMSGGTIRVMWTIIDENNHRVLPSKYGFFSWVRKKDAQKVLYYINTNGLDYVKEKLK